MGQRQSGGAANWLRTLLQMLPCCPGRGGEEGGLFSVEFPVVLWPLGQGRKGDAGGSFSDVGIAMRTREGRDWEATGCPFRPAGTNNNRICQIGMFRLFCTSLC